MVNSKRATLLKMFSTILRSRSKDEKFPKLTTSLVEQYSRKELIDIIKQKFKGSIPKEFDLMEMENVELLTVIGDDMFLISYSTQQWTVEQEKKIPVINEASVTSLSAPKEEKVERKTISISKNKNSLSDKSSKSDKTKP